MSFEELGFHAQEIYEMAVEKYLRDEHMIDERDGLYYAPTDPMSGQPMMTEEVLRKTVWDTEMKFNEIHSLFNDFLVLPDPGDFDGPIQSVTTCMDALCSKAFTDPIQGDPHPINVELKAMTVTGSTIDEWDGLAAKAFMNNFVIPFEGRTENQFTVASILMNALNANKELWKRARANIDDIAHKVKSALDHYDDCGKNEWEIGLSVVGAVVAIAAVPVTGGASAIALGAVASAVDVASTFAGQIEDPPKNDYSAESVEGVIAKAKQGIEDLKTEVARAEQKIVDAMTNSSGVVAGHATDFLAPRPTLAGAPGQPRRRPARRRLKDEPHDQRPRRADRDREHPRRTRVRDHHRPHARPDVARARLLRVGERDRPRATADAAGQAAVRRPDAGLLRGAQPGLRAALHP